MSEAILESMRSEGLHRHNRARFHYLEVLARRLPLQPPAVQEVLQQRWRAAVADYAECARVASGMGVSVGDQPPESPLVRLNRDLQAVADDAPAVAGAASHLPDLKGLRRFSEVWAKISAEQQVAQALVRGPENAGPLNSHRLLLRSLHLMRALSPDYTRHFLAQMDALLWLDQAQTSAAPPAARAGRKKRR